MNLKFETIVQIFRKIIQLNAVIILKSTNEYYQKLSQKVAAKWTFILRCVFTSMTVTLNRTGRFDDISVIYFKLKSMGVSTQ